MKKILSLLFCFSVLVLSGCRETAESDTTRIAEFSDRTIIDGAIKVIELAGTYSAANAKSRFLEAQRHLVDNAFDKFHEGMDREVRATEETQRFEVLDIQRSDIKLERCADVNAVIVRVPLRRHKTIVNIPLPIIDMEYAIAVTRRPGTGELAISELLPGFAEPKPGKQHMQCAQLKGVSGRIDFRKLLQKGFIGDSLVPGRELDLSAMHLTRDDLEQLKTSDFENVVMVSLAGSDISDENLALLKYLKKLEQLDLSDTRIKGSGLSKLTGLYLREINLSRTKVNLEMLANLKLFPLEKLDLSHTNFGDEGAAELASFPSYRDLDAHYPRILFDEGPFVVIHVSPLTDLNLAGTKITDKGLQVISRVPYLL